MLSALAGTAQAGSDHGNLQAAADSLAKIVKSAKNIKDDFGRIRYIVDLVDEEVVLPKSATSKEEILKIKRESTENAVHKLIRDNAEAVEILGGTAYVGTSFFAYLTDKQAEKFAKDKRVRRITESTYDKTSALWVDVVNGGETVSWGWQAMRADIAPNPGFPIAAMVYVLDTGAEQHADLPSIYRTTSYQFRTPPFSGPWVVPSHWILPTGCWPHATRVTGIISATPYNSIGTRGIAPTANVTSIALGNLNYKLWTPPEYLNGAGNNGGDVCAGGTENYGSIPVERTISTLDHLYATNISSWVPAIVNMSFNGANYSHRADQTVGEKMKKLATPTDTWAGWNTGYRGALIIQSAGNNGDDACLYAYSDPSIPTDTIDGVLVVGGLNDNGVPASFTQEIEHWFNPAQPPQNPAISAGSSNHGACVDVWAPSSSIMSTWTGSHYQRLSGTSMAAPHVAAFAARLMQSSPVATSFQLEAAVRAMLVNPAGAFDNNVSPPRSIRMPRF